MPTKEYYEQRHLVTARGKLLADLKMSRRARRAIEKILLVVRVTTEIPGGPTLGQIADHVTLADLFMANNCGSTTRQEIKDLMIASGVPLKESREITLPGPPLLENIPKGTYFCAKPAHRYGDDFRKKEKQICIFSYNQNGEYEKLVHDGNTFLFKKVTYRSIGNIIAICHVPKIIIKS